MRVAPRTDLAMLRIRTLLAALPLLALPLLSPAPAGAASATAAASCQVPAVIPGSGAGQGLLRDVRVGRHDRAGFDRVVFYLGGRSGAPAQRARVQYVPAVYADGTGDRLTLRGKAFLTVDLQPAVAHNEAGRPTTPRRIVVPYKALREVRLAGDFEGQVSYGLGVAARSDFRVFSLSAPNRLVVDIAAPGKHPFDCRPGAVRVYFGNSNATATAVARRVPPPNVAFGAMTALFAGPTEAEYNRGLRFVASGASGFANLSISLGVARVRLTGGCRSGGSTFTIANEITPTLKQFRSVRYVKVLDPLGRTARPTGLSDSIPVCLEP